MWQLGLSPTSRGESVHPFGFDLARVDGVGVFIPLSFCSAVTMHWMDCFPQKCCLVAVMPSINPCEVSVLLGDKWADVWESMKGSSTAR